MHIDFEPGDYVENPANKEWGIGQVQSIAGNKVTVNFENFGKRVININNVNQAPEITQKNYPWYLDDTRNISIEASDPENDRLFYELSGSDKNSFTISKTGNLRLLSDENIKRKTVFNNFQLTDFF